jgi:antitoxin component YwqK of YwqJK toxin-antitoxin module
MELIEYFDSGVPKLRCELVDGKPDGPVTLYGESGEMVQTSMFSAGVLSGETVIYQASRVAARIAFEAGKRNGEMLTWSAPGTLQARERYKDGLREGEAEYYTENGRLAKKVNYSKNLQNGKTVEYHLNGQAREIANYKDDLLEGELLRYSDDGKLKERLWYAAGKPVVRTPAGGR